MSAPTIVVLEGDQTGQELLAESLRLLDESVIDIPLNFERYDLSLEKRRETNNQIVHDASAAMRAHKLGLKAATITPEIKGDVGSPNAILRKAIDGKVIVRTGRKLPRVRPVAGIHAPISVVRMAVGDAYGAKVKAWMKSLAARKRFRAASAASSPNTPSCTRRRPRAQKSLAAPNTR